MDQPRDTSAEAHAAHMAVYRGFSGEKRMELGLRMSDEGRELARSGVALRHPEYTAEQLEDAVRVLYLGREVFEQVWPGRRVPAP